MENVNKKFCKNIFPLVIISEIYFLIFLKSKKFRFIFRDFLREKKYQKNAPSFNRFHIQILLNDFGFREISIDPRHVSYGKIVNLSKSSPGGLWKRLIDCLPTCPQGSP